MDWNGTNLLNEHLLDIADVLGTMLREPTEFMAWVNNYGCVIEHGKAADVNQTYS